MSEIFSGNGFAIINNNGDYSIEWPQGPFGQIVSYPITKKLATKAFKSANDAYEVMIYAETGLWPTKNTEEEENEQARKIVRKFPELLIKVPDNQDLFTEEELKELLPAGGENISKDGELNNTNSNV